MIELVVPEDHQSISSDILNRAEDILIESQRESQIDLIQDLIVEYVPDEHAIATEDLLDNLKQRTRKNPIGLVHELIKFKPLRDAVIDLVPETHDSVASDVLNLAQDFTDDQVKLSSEELIDSVLEIIVDTVVPEEHSKTAEVLLETADEIKEKLNERKHEEIPDTVAEAVDSLTMTHAQPRSFQTASKVTQVLSSAAEELIKVVKSN